MNLSRVKKIAATLIILCSFTATSARAQLTLDNSNVASGVVIPLAGPIVAETWGPGCASVIFRFTVMLGNGWFDAIAPYHPTAVGIYSDLGRRPTSEAMGRRNKNIAMLYASYHILNSLLPEHRMAWRGMLTRFDLNPDDPQRNTVTPIGIGNMAADAVLAARLPDGMNQLGDAGGCKYNCRPYANTTGYTPVNTAYELLDPSRWAPYVHTSGNGIFTVQQFVTPQYATAKPYSYADPTVYSVPAPEASNVENFELYKEQADIVLAASAALNDETKLQAELFDNKYRGYGAAVTWATRFPTTLSQNQYVYYYLTANMAAFDAGIVAWQEKYKYDAVRPYSAIPHIYGDDPVTAWGGVGVGTVSDMPGKEWRQYLNVADHPEYPSGSGTFCNAIAHASRLFMGSDQLDFSVTFMPGTSAIEPGIVPAQQVTLNYPTWTDWEEACLQARIDGGVHFPASVEVVGGFSREIATLAYEFVQRHIQGNP